MNTQIDRTDHFEEVIVQLVLLCSHVTDTFRCRLEISSQFERVCYKEVQRSCVNGVNPSHGFFKLFLEIKLKKPYD